MSVEERKNECLKSLNELESETKILLERIEKARKELPDVKTEEDLEAFCENNDLEEGFEHIELF